MMIQFVKKYLGWRNWAVFYYNSVTENFFVICYIIFITKNFSDTIIIQIFLFLFFSIFSTTYGYLVNDFADKDLDKLHNKSNTFSADSKKTAIVVVLIALSISILFSIPFIKNDFFLILWLTWLLLATFYSLPPLRFKEKGKLGLILVVFAQRVLPILILFAAFQFDRLLDILFIMNLILFRGFASDIYHQLEDFENDLITGTQTSAVEFGKSKLESIFRFVLEYEKIALLIVLVMFYVNLTPLKYLNIPVLSIPILLYLLGYGFSLLRKIKYGKLSVYEMNPFKNGRDIYQLMHLAFPNVFFPIYLLIFIAINNWHFLIFIIGLIFIYRLYDLKFIKNSFISEIFRFKK